jgi:hypothetical protein
MENKEKSVEEFIRDDPGYQRGQKVRILGKPINCVLNDPTGVIIKRDEYPGSYLIHLNKPGLYLNADGTSETLDVIRDEYDNFEPISDELK